MLISKSKADKYFPGKDPVGKLIYLNNDKNKVYKIGGVMEDLPSTSHLYGYHFFLTLKGVELWEGEQDAWNSSNYIVYVLLKPGVDVTTFNRKMTNDLLKNYYIPSIAWLLMDKWLQNFSYRINISWWMFVLAGVVSIVIAVLTVGYQSIKAALMNPAKNLKLE